MTQTTILRPGSHTCLVVASFLMLAGGCTQPAEPRADAGGDSSIDMSTEDAVVEDAVMEDAVLLDLGPGGVRDVGPDMPVDTAVDTGPGEVTCNERLDLLFVVDNSNSMAEEQANLAAQIPELIEAIILGDSDGDGIADQPPVRDIHIGVVSSDMGVGGNRLPSCGEGLGDDGRLLLPEDCRGDESPDFLGFMDLSDTEGASCAVQQGIGGCGFEQHFEATLKALTPSTSTVRFAAASPDDRLGQADRANVGFLRDDAALAVIVLADEDDCSAADPSIFSLDDSAHDDVPINVRCGIEGVLYDVERYVSGLTADRNPERLAFVAIVGAPADLASADYETVLADPRMVNRVDEVRNTFVPSCETVGRGQATPPIRFVSLLQSLEESGAQTGLISICEEFDIKPAIGTIGSALATACE